MDIKKNKDTIDLLAKIERIAEEKPELLNARENEIYVRLSETGFREATAALAERKFSLIGLFCAEAFEKEDGFTLFYAFKKAGKAAVLVLVREVDRETGGQAGRQVGEQVDRERKTVQLAVPSIAEIFPSASWFEREIMDGFGLEFTGAFDTRRLFLH